MNQVLHGILLPPAIIAGVLITSHPASAALVNHWSMEEGAGFTTADVVGGKTGTLTNMEAGDWTNVGLAPIPGGTTQALTFDGTNEEVVATGYKGITGTAARSMTAWVKTNVTNDSIMTWGTNVAGQKWVWRLNDVGANGTVGALRLEVNGGYSIGTTVINDGNWHQVTAILPADTAPNATDIRFYVDGQLEAISGELAVAINTLAGTDVRIGNDPHSPGRFWNGQIDDARIYSHGLSSKEVTLLTTGVATALPTVEYNASFDPTPANNTWEEKLGAATAANLNANGLSIGAAPLGSPTITSVYQFDGSNRATGNAFENFDGDPTKESATFEVWFKPSDLVGNEILLETGGNGDGLSFTLAGSNLRFIAKNQAISAAQTGSLTGLGNLIQAVGVVDMDADILSLYINGELIGTSGFTGLDWGGTDGTGLGGLNGATIGGDGGVLGSLAGFGNFVGSVGFLRFYEEALTAAEIRQSYLDNRVIPEPSALLLGLMGISALATRRRKVC